MKNGEPPSAVITFSEMPPPVRIFRFWKSFNDWIGFLVNIWPGPWVQTASRWTPLYSPSFWKCFQWMRENATELTSAVSPAPGSSAMSGMTWRAGV